MTWDSICNRKMLLRSSSTPILGSLLSSVSSFEGISGGGDGDKISLPCPQSGLWSMTSPSSMSMCEEASSRSSWDLDGEYASWHDFNLRRAQSDTDLHSLGVSRSSSSPAQVAAETLLQGAGAHSPYDDFHVSSFQKHKHWSCRQIVQRKLQTIPSFHGSGTEDEDEDDENIDNNSTENNSSVQTSHAFTKDTTLSKENNLIKSFSFQNLTGQQEEENSLQFIGNSIISQVNDTAQNDNLTENSEGLFSMGLNPNLYGREMMQSGIATLDKEDAHPLFLAQGLGLDFADTSLAMGGDGGKSSRKLNTGGGGGDGDEAGSNNIEEFYQSMLEMDPENPLLLRNYAQFLFETKHDYPMAEEFYSRAILAQPGDGEVLSQYAKLIWDFHKDEERASAYFEQAIKASPDDCHVHAAYAFFLWDTDKEEEEEHNDNHSFSDIGNLYGAVTSAAA